MPINVLVTGGAGYIGSHTAKALHRAGFLPITYDNLIAGHREAVRWGPLEEGDVGDRSRISELLRRHDIAAILHFAAFAYVGESMAAPERYFENNVAKSLILLDTALKAGVRHVVFSSSCATYGSPDQIPITEDTPQRPVNPYGESKLMVERALHWFGVAHGLNSVALRYFNAAGADPEGDLGEDHSPETHLLPLALDAALGRRTLDIYGTDYPTHDGTCIRDYVHVTDLADAHVRALDYLLRGGPSAALNLGTGQGHSVREVVAAVERVSGCRVLRRFAPRRPGDPPVLVAAAERAQALLGWRPVHSELDTMARTAWSWHRSRFGTVAA